MAVTVTSYRLRGGKLQPRVGCNSGGTPEFYAQSFGVEKLTTDVYDAKTTLLSSNDMQGQKYGDVEDPTYIQETFIKASYQGKALRTTDGELVFSASEEHVSEFVEEEEIGL